MVNDLVRNAPVVLQDIVIRGAAGESDFLCDGLYETDRVSPVTCEAPIIAFDPIEAPVPMESCVWTKDLGAGSPYVVPC